MRIMKGLWGAFEDSNGLPALILSLGWARGPQTICGTNLACNGNAVGIILSYPAWAIHIFTCRARSSNSSQK